MVPWSSSRMIGQVSSSAASRPAKRSFQLGERRRREGRQVVSDRRHRLPEGIDDIGGVVRTRSLSPCAFMVEKS